MSGALQDSMTPSGLGPGSSLGSGSSSGSGGCGPWAGPAGPGQVAGTVAPGLEPVRELMAEMAAQDPDYSAQLSAYVGGQQVVDLWAGPHQGADTLTGVFSCTKGVSALTLARLVEAGELDLEAPVARYWPEFAAAGKESVTVTQLLSHQAGVVGVPGARISTRYDSREIAAGLAAMRPLWRPAGPSATTAPRSARSWRSSIAAWAARSFRRPTLARSASATASTSRRAA